MGSLAGPLAMPLGGDLSAATGLICNPSRGGIAPTVAGDPTGVKALDKIRASFRSVLSNVSFSSLRAEVGFSKTHALGADGRFDRQFSRTKLLSLLGATLSSPEATISVLPLDGLRITKTQANPQPSVFFTPIDQGGVTKSAMISAVLRADVNPSYGVDTDPMGPLLGMENGPRNTAVYVTLLDTGTFKAVRVMGPSVGGVRVPDLYYPYDWGATHNQYIIFWNETLGQVEVWVDDTAGAGGFGKAELITAISIASFQQFGLGGTVPVGGAGDLTGVYGVEGKFSNSATIRSVAIATDAGSPVNAGARAGGWKSYLDSDVTMGFSGAVDPTRLDRGGAWFFDQANDVAGQLLINHAGGFCTLEKNTPLSSFSIFRDEPGFLRMATDGIMLEFKCNISTTGGSGFETGAAIAIWDGVSLYQLDFLYDGAVQNIGLLKDGGNPGDPNSHLLPATPVDFKFKTLRLVIDPGRATIDVFDVGASLSTPVATWTLNRSLLPMTNYAGISIGLPVSSTSAVGRFDIYSLKYSYIYNSWETRDAIAPTAATPVWNEASADMAIALAAPMGMPLGGLGPPSTPGTASLESDGYHIICAGGETLVYNRVTQLDATKGGAIEFSMKIDKWHPFTRTGAFAILDDALNAYMLSFVETDTGRYVCIPLAAGAGSYQEYAGRTGLGAKLSIPLDWTQEHIYRLERRPRDGVYLFVDDAPTPAIALPETARYSFPVSRFTESIAMFGHFTEEGGESVWRYVRTLFGVGYELSTALDITPVDMKTRLSNVRTTVVLSAGE